MVCNNVQVRQAESLARGNKHFAHALQFNHLFDNISEGDIKGFVFQQLTNSLVQLSIFLIDLFVGTYRLSSYARLEAFVIQTKLNNSSNEDHVKLDFPISLSI